MQRTYGIKLIALIGTLAGMLATGGCGKQSSQSGPPPGGPPEVGVVAVAPESVTLTMELAGRTSPHLIAEVRPQVGGIIKARLFTEGADVKAGEVLYQIDPAPFQAAFASAEAALAKARSAHASAQAALALAQANAVPLRLRAERLKELAAEEAASRQDSDDAAAAVQQAEAAIEGAGAAVKGAEAEIAGAAAALDTARINLAYTRMSAPIAGRIGKSAVTTGALVTANQPTALATIQQLDPIYVDMTQSSAELLRLRRSLDSGQIKGNGAGHAKARLLLEDGSSYPQEGSLEFREVTVDQSTGSVTLRALFPNPDHLLLPGMFVRGVVQEGVRDNVMLVPQRGVSRDAAGNAMAMVVGNDSKVEPRMLKAERAVGDNWLVSEGLQAGEQVILEGLQRARPGTEVKPVPFGAKSEAAASGPAPAGKN